MAEEDPWLSLTEAAQRSGLAREAVRARARRGQVPSRKGNAGQLLVQLPAELLATPGQGVAGPQADVVADLLAEVADLRAELARAEAERDAAESVTLAQVEAAREAATARVDAAKLEVAAVRELADRLTAELADLRRPWWRRWIGGLVVGVAFLGSTAKADGPMVGKYACIVENAAGVFDRNKNISISPIKLKNNKFILTLSDNDYNDQTFACEGAVDPAHSGNTDLLDMFRLHCGATKILKMSSEDVFEKEMYGVEKLFYGLHSMFVIFDENSDKFGFILSEIIKGDSGGVEQYTTRGSCEKF